MHDVLKMGPPLACSMLLFAACNHPTQTPASTAERHPAPGMHHVGTPDGVFTVHWTPSPAPIPLNDFFELQVWVHENGSPAEDIRLQVDAAMPEHHHGMNTTPQHEAQSDGSHVVRGMLFHMPGHWELYFDITRAGITQRAAVDVDLE